MKSMIHQKVLDWSQQNVALREAKSSYSPLPRRIRPLSTDTRGDIVLRDQKVVDQMTHRPYNKWTLVLDENEAFHRVF